jgi:hypothetical protein
MASKSKSVPFAQVHRFGDSVAIYIGTGETVYLSEKTARDIARSLNACARDIQARKFTQSKFSTVEFPTLAEQVSGNEYINGVPLRCFDNGGKTADRYTVVYMNEPEGDKRFACRGMNAEPFHPQGIGMSGTATCGAHLGKRIAFRSLPQDCQKLVMRDTLGS